MKRLRDVGRGRPTYHIKSKGKVFNETDFHNITPASFKYRPNFNFINPGSGKCKQVSIGNAAKG